MTQDCDGTSPTGRTGQVVPFRPRSELAGNPKPDHEAIAVVEVKGDSMMPTLKPGDMVMAALGDTAPTPGGLFLVDSGLGPIIQRVEYVPHSEPPRVRISFDNAAYSKRECALSEVAIVARVVGALQRF